MVFFVRESYNNLETENSRKRHKSNS